MSRIPTVFQISAYGLAAIAGSMLAFAEGNPFPAILTAPIALMAYVLTDRARTVHLPVLWANILGLAAFAVAGWQMYDTTLEERILGAGHLLVYLSWIVLFQKKNVVQYWWMCALAVLQVALGSILTIATSYGGMLVAFMFASIWTLSLLSLYEAYLQFEAAEPGELAESGAAARKSGVWTMGRRAAAERARTLWRRPSATRGTIQLDPEERWLGLRYTRSILGIGMAALVVAAGFFLFIPRLWAGRTEWGNTETRQARTAGITGFTTEVRLGDMVPLLENSKRVLQISLFDPNGNPLDLEKYCAQLGYAEPLFRGAMLSTYEKATWVGSGHQATWIPQPTYPNRRSIRQQILMEPIGTSLLFAIHPAYGVRFPNPQERAQLIPGTGQLFRPDGIPTDKAISYDAFSPQPDPARSALMRARNVESMTRSEQEEFYRTYLQLAPGGMPRLVQLAKKVTGDGPLDASPEDRNRRLIDQLCRYLRDSGEFRYSLDTSVADPKIDPVEDFLLNRKAGHCEYFASALCLMLRAVNVPARLASGFKGGAINAISGAYEVEQRHAHVWVEAYIGESWMTVDPTPAARDASVASFAASVKSVHELASVVSSTWARLMNMNINEQQTAFYVPIVNAVKNWWYPANGSRPFLAELYLGLIAFATDPTQWFTLKGIVVVTAIGSVLAAIALLYRMRMRIWQRLLRLVTRGGASVAVRIAFYERFEAVCRQLGLARSRHETQWEFAGTVGSRIRQTVPSANGLPDLPPRLVEFFYRVRFGDEDLSPTVVEELNRDLTKLEGALREARRRRPGDTSDVPRR